MEIQLNPEPSLSNAFLIPLSCEYQDTVEEQLVQRLRDRGADDESDPYTQLMLGH